MKKPIYINIVTLVTAGLIIASATSIPSIAKMSRSIPDPNNSFVDLTGESMPGMTTCPAGTNHSNPFHMTILTYEYIQVTCRDASDDPIEGIEAHDFSFEVNPTGDAKWFSTLECVFTAVDVQTNADGEIRFEIVGDTSIVGNITIEVTVRGIQINDVDTLWCNTFGLAPKYEDGSPDGIIGLADFVTFQSKFDTTDWLADFNWNGEVGLADFVTFQAHFGHTG